MKININFTAINNTYQELTGQLITKEKGCVLGKKYTN